MVLKDTSLTIIDQEIEKTISFRPVKLTKDVNRLHNWMHQPHVIPFWNLAISLEDYEKHLQNFMNDNHQTLYIGELDGTPMSYWEAYWAKEDIIGQYYNVDPYDQGIHLLIGPSEYIGKGLSLPFLRTMVKFQFRHLQTKKVIAEPDIRNEKMIHLFEKCGFEKVKPVELPDKTGMLMFCDRERFKRRWNYEDL
ncbi:acetyltransferase [Chengkuizengella sediminis]|nr:acetyltransferase [Chengkuizengella sediminis]